MKESSMVVAGSLMEIVDSVIVSMIEIFGNAHCSHGNRSESINNKHDIIEGISNCNHRSRNISIRNNR